MKRILSSISLVALLTSGPALAGGAENTLQAWEKSIGKAARAEIPNETATALLVGSPAPI